MKQILPGIWQWSCFSEEKQLDFNGLLLAVGEHRVIVDPPPMTSETLEQAKRGGPVDYIVITNRDHEREAASLKRELKCQVWLPEADAPQMEIKADKTYTDGELLPGGIWAIHLKDQKSPGECALYLEHGRGIMIVGDALIGRPPGSLSLLPAEKYIDVRKAREGLRRLLRYNFETLLVGDGVSIVSEAKQVVERVLQPKELER
jgi:glyoxylase-like metal-dependent hydrolase (beta-lactamase superfamily II)